MSNRLTPRMTFDEALAAMRNGEMVTHPGTLDQYVLVDDPVIGLGLRYHSDRQAHVFPLTAVDRSSTDWRIVNEGKP